MNKYLIVYTVGANTFNVIAEASNMVFAVRNFQITYDKGSAILNIIELK